MNELVQGTCYRTGRQESVVRAAAMLAALCLAGGHAEAQPCNAPPMPTIVQISGMQVGPQGDNLICELRGQVIASFAGNLPVGETIRTTIPCTGPIEPGFGSSYFVPEEVEAAAVMELHFDDRGMVGQTETGGSLAFLLDAPTTGPRQIGATCIIQMDENGSITYVDPATGAEVSLD